MAGILVSGLALYPCWLKAYLLKKTLVKEICSSIEDFGLFRC